VYVANVLNTEQTQLSTRYDLVKKYVEGETKEQRKARKALDKLAKQGQELGLYDIPYNANPLIKDKYYVLCLKHGTKYSSEYVNKLYNMVKRNCTLDIEFVCLTDNPKDINSNVKIIKLPAGIAGWWCKPYIFSNDLPLKGTILYMDLDVVIADNIDGLFTFGDNKWCTIRDFTRKMRPTWPKYNSSVIKFKSGQLDYLWKNFKKNQQSIQKTFYGDQDWLYDATHEDNPAQLYPDNWIQSWKWEVRQTRDLKYNMPRGQRQLRTIEHCEPPAGCCICVFHGDPNPENCEDPWVVKHWT
jgi:hypothetical protein